MLTADLRTATAQTRSELARQLGGLPAGATLTFALHRHRDVIRQTVKAWERARLDQATAVALVAAREFAAAGEAVHVRTVRALCLALAAIGI